MSDWATAAASGATAFGTLVLAVATFSSVRSAHRSARATESALLAGIRPVLVPSRLEDPTQKVRFVDDRWFHVEGGRAVAEVGDDAIYLLMSVRNVGNGLAVLDRWEIMAGRVLDPPATDRESLRRLTRDIYVPAGDVGFWQGALRDPDDPLFAAIRDAIEKGEPMTVDVLYGDHEGGQRTISRFALFPSGEGKWLTVVGRHWNLDRPDPRQAD